MHMGDRFTSGNWIVKDGMEADFLSRWTELAEWAKTSAGDSSTFILMKDAADPRHYVSMGGWADKASVDAWRSTPEFAQKLSRCREVCEAFRPNDYNLAVEIG